MKTLLLLAALGQFTDPGPVRTGGTGTTHPRAPITAEGGTSSPALIATALPRVWMVTSKSCGPCQQAELWMKDNHFPFHVTRTAPLDGEATPTWKFQGANGEWWQVVGWQGRPTVEHLVAQYREKNPVSEPVAAPRRAPEAETTVDTIRRFAGRGGRFVFVPDQPQTAQVTDGVTIDVGEIRGRYDLTGPEPRIVFDQPTPRGTVEKFGLGIGYRVEGATWSPPKNEVRVATNWKTIRISLE